MVLQQLTNMHFDISDGKTMYLKLRGISFVLFKTAACTHCKSLVPIFNSLSNDSRITMCVADVGSHRNIVQMSMRSTTPIKNVPMMILYSDGKPHANYNGERNINSIKQFIDTMLNQIGSSHVKSFQAPQPIPPPHPMQPSFSQQSSFSQQTPYSQPSYSQPSFSQPQPDSYSRPKEPQPDMREEAVNNNLPKNVVPHNAPYMFLKKQNY